ncbi:ATP-binding protein [Candidatus Peregrinibacteria bacterium]|nr:ATP-binding protein [Candidatus Peregrinibacteria bacterium]
MPLEKEKIQNFLNEQIAQADFRTRAYVYDRDGKLRPRRDIFQNITRHIHKFYSEKSTIRWITLTGLRGAGKTTVLSQAYDFIRNLDCHKLFLSLDQTSQILGVSLPEVISAYEDLLGKSLEMLDRPLFLFLDEVQYDEKWGITLKSIYDRSENIFIFSTGSSALLMNKNKDIVRRTVYEKLFPLSFCEYLKIKHKKHPDENRDLSQEISRAIFFSKNAKDAYSQLQKLQRNITKYYAGIIYRHEFKKYLYYGSLPYMLTVDNEAIIYDQISKTMDRVVAMDIRSAKNFTSDIISKIPRILYAVADMDAFNFSTLSEAFQISRPKVMEIFDFLEQTEVLHRIYPHGSHLGQEARKPSKYLFSSPAFRAMYYKMVGNIISPENAKGRLLEDLVGMYLYRLFAKNPEVSFTYDSAQGGADFIVGIGGRKIVIEVGSGQKSYRQVISTAKKVKPAYSLIISDEELEFSEELNALKVPFNIFVLA